MSVPAGLVALTCDNFDSHLSGQNRVQITGLTLAAREAGKLNISSQAHGCPPSKMGFFLWKPGALGRQLAAHLREPWLCDHGKAFPRAREHIRHLGVAPK